MYQKKIDQICEFILEYKFNDSIQNLVTVLDQILAEKNIEQEKSNSINEILNYLDIALENKDYLFVHDLLKYELKPMLINK
ncbi:hypothetical protein ABE078_24245 [Priestia megaterium]